MDPNAAAKDAATWERVVRKLSAGEMPPAGLPRPDKPTIAAFLSHLEANLDKAAAADPNPGRPTVHRLNRAEYRNSVRDLLALDIDVSATLPGDDSGYGFDNIADVLSVSPALLERYISVAHMVSRLAVGDTNVKPYEKTIQASDPAGGAKPPAAERASDDLPFGSRNGISAAEYFPVDAEYVVRFDVANASLGQNAKPPELRLPIKAGLHTLQVAFFRDELKPEVAAPVGGRGAFGAGRGQAAARPPVKMDFRMDGARIKLFELPGGAAPAQLTDLVLNGPFNITGPGDSASRRKIFTCHPANAPEEEPCARKILTGLAQEAYRRPVTQADVSPLVGFYQRGRTKRDFDFGIEQAIEAMLVSPNFLFRVEKDPAGPQGPKVHPVSDVELASRISYFLWSSMPDERLLSLAEKGKLRQPGVLDGEVARMLEDPKSDAFVSNFAGQWLYLRNLPTIQKDPVAFPGFDSELRASMRKETELFFTDFMRNNRSVLDFLDANFTYVNQRLARHYGIPGVYGSQFRRVTLTDPNRFGLLGQASILTVTAYPNRTSVVQRGKWVLDNLLGSPPPPPPPDIPELKPHGGDGKMTQRQAMEAHRANPICAACHQRMDPIGFSLENYDGVGHWRDKEESGARIDNTGKFPDGTVFSGPTGLDKLLLEKKEQFIETLSSKLLTYALGRGLEYYDEPALRAITRKTATCNYAFDSLITAIIESTPFQMRRTAEQ